MNFQKTIDWVTDRLKGPGPITHVVGGQPYAIKADGTLGEPVRQLPPQWTKPTLEVSTVSGLVGAYKAKIDDLPETGVAFHIVSPTRVNILSLTADEFGRRHVWASAQHTQECPFKFGHYMDAEAFLIAFRSSFYFNDNAVKIQKLLSTLSNESAVSVADDGISQTLTVKAGAVTRTAVELPQEIPLIPWRTFREVAPVESKFLLRLKGEPGKVPQAALFEIDAKWQMDTVNSIATYLRTELPDATILT